MLFDRGGSRQLSAGSARAHLNLVEVEPHKNRHWYAVNMDSPKERHELAYKLYMCISIDAIDDAMMQLM